MLSWPEKRLRKGVKKRVIRLTPVLSGDDASLYRHLVARLNPTPIKLKPIIMFHAPIPGTG
jgi:hypothetical protein